MGVSEWKEIIENEIIFAYEHNRLNINTIFVVQEGQHLFFPNRKSTDQEK